VWPVGVVILNELPQHGGEVVGSGDQKVTEQSRCSLPIQRAAMAVVRGARIGVRTMRMSAPAKPR
jgi:hypothetical protein